MLKSLDSVYLTLSHLLYRRRKWDSHFFFITRYNLQHICIVREHKHLWIKNKKRQVDNKNKNDNNVLYDSKGSEYGWLAWHYLATNNIKLLIKHCIVVVFSSACLFFERLEVLNGELPWCPAALEWFVICHFQYGSKMQWKF